MKNNKREVGTKLKELRKTKGYTLTDLAEKTDLSAAYLSNIERDQTSPTVNNLFKISRALGVEIIDIMEDATVAKPSLIVRKSERENLFNTNSNICYESITGSAHDITGVCITIDSDCYDEVVSTGHANYSELGIVAKGSMLFKMNNTQEILNEGDTVYVERNAPHGYRKHGEGPCVTYWIHTRGTISK